MAPTLDHLAASSLNVWKVNRLYSGRPLQLTHSWQLHEPELGQSIVERMRSRVADVSTFATKLASSEELRDVLPEPMSKYHVYLVVQCPDSESNGSFVHVYYSDRSCRFLGCQASWFAQCRFGERKDSPNIGRG
jgi:hypothetical protein